MKNLWILTEERPKIKVLETILELISKEHGFKYQIINPEILPIIRNGNFTFTYKLEGVESEGFENVYIKLASGNSSFVDFLVFLQEQEPVEGAEPLYAIEETKTDDSESRNTGVYQRCSKFVYIDFFFPNVRKVMLYNLQIAQKESPTSTNVFGTRMLRTVGVEVLGKVIDNEVMRPFESLDELISFKGGMRKAPKGNTPIQIKNTKDAIIISGKLFKSGGLSHDPNIGALSIISACVRKWEPHKKIVITNHGLSQEHIGRTNKFIRIANKLKIELEGLTMPVVTPTDLYWHYEKSQEKVATIFIDIVLSTYTKAEIIYSNHAGSERGYFLHTKYGPIAIPKYKEGMRLKYKQGDKDVIIHIPDIVVYDRDRNLIIDVEGKKYSTRMQGIEDLKNYEYLDEKIIKPSHDPELFSHTVVVFGSNETTINEPEIGFMLNEDGKMVLGKNAPEIIREAIDKLLGN